MWVLVLPSVCCCVSVTASISLLKGLMAVGPQHRRTLMARELWHLAVADILFSVTGILYTCGATLDLPDSGGLNIFCKVSQILFSVGFFSSAFVETILALSLTAALLRSSLTLSFLGCVLVPAWPVATLLSIVSTFLGKYQWSKESCTYTRNTVMNGVTAVVAVGISFISYAVCFFRVKRSERVGLSVRTKVVYRARFFLVAFFVCTFPWITIRCFSVHSSGLTALCDSLLGLRGLANFLVYARQSNYVQRLSNRSEGQLIPATIADHTRFSFCVMLGSVTVAEDLSTLPSEVESRDEFQSTEGILTEVTTCLGQPVQADAS